LALVIGHPPQEKIMQASIFIPVGIALVGFGRSADYFSTAVQAIQIM
jgi:hypothetical protein